MLSANGPAKCAFNDCLHLGEPGCIVKGDWERYSFYFQLLDEIRIREEFQLRTFGTKKEADVRCVKLIMVSDNLLIFLIFMVSDNLILGILFRMSFIGYKC